ncbi:MAG: hypothetical protein VKN33_11115 [Candidatus Sericytochromatia bacterium]|nr:hypothetical protein [Candidatus Sericytochromatia bacterium]
MSDSLSTAEFEQVVVKVSEKLDDLRGKARFATANGALPYSGLDITEHLGELAPILATLIRQDPEEPVTTNARLEVGGRRLALTAISALLLQGDGLADFPARYKNLMGCEPEWDLFSKLLPTAMREAGLAVPPRGGSGAMLEALLLSAGLPHGLMSAVAEYFVIYWRYFHPCESAMAPLESAQQFASIPAPEQTTLKDLRGRLLPNAGVVKPVLDELAILFEEMRSSPQWRVGDLFNQSENIKAHTGIDPKRLLQSNEAALEILISGLSKAWHPSQFQCVLASHPRGSEVRLPSGSLAMVDKAFRVPQWGLYRIEHKTYMVTPNEGLDLSDLLTINEVGFLGARVFWRGEAEPAITLDGLPGLEEARAVFDDDRQPRGYVWMARAVPGQVLGTDGTPWLTLSGVHWGATLVVQPLADGEPRLSIALQDFRVSLPAHKGASLQLSCAAVTSGAVAQFDLDEAGNAHLPNICVPLDAPEPGSMELRLQDGSTGEDIKLDGQSLVHPMTLPDMMLISQNTQEKVAPRDSHRRFGAPSYWLFATRPVNTGALQMRDIGVQTCAKHGAFDIHSLSWTDPASALEIYVDGRFQWNFDYRIDNAFQAADLPEAPVPLVFAPHTPRTFTVASVDSLYIDDVSMLENTWVSLERDHHELFRLSWNELNWLMNFPVENRRLSGAMVRRILDVAPEADLAGRYILRLHAAGSVLGSRELLILPTLDVVVAPQGLVDEDAVFTLTARGSLPCFPGHATESQLILGRPVVDRDAMENPPFAPKPLEGKLVFAHPPVEIGVSVVPDVGGFRLLDDNEGTWVRKTVLGFEELDHLTLVLFAAQGVSGVLRAGLSAPLVEEFYEGFATFALGSVQTALNEHETEMEVEIDGRSFGTLTVVWHPRITRFEVGSEYLLDGVALVDLAAVGPGDVPIRLEAFSPSGERLAKLEVETDGNIDRVVMFPIPGSKEHPVVTIKAFVPSIQGGMAAGTIEVRNATFEPEIEALNTQIAAEPRSAELRYERAQLLLVRGLRKAAARDFQAAIDLGMSELIDSPQYQQFLSQRRAEGFHEDIKALASFFVPFARKELSIG